MRASASYASVGVLACTFALLLVTIRANPLMAEEEDVENGIMARPEAGELGGQWDAVNAEGLRKLLMQLDEERLARASRGWAAEPRGWGLRAADGRIARPWRADKRQVRFRQCYFNPISCFRK